MAQNTWTRRRRDKRRREEQDRHEERREQRRASFLEQGHAVLGLEEAEEHSDRALHRTVRSGRRGDEAGARDDAPATATAEGLVVHYRRNQYEVRLDDGRLLTAASRSTTRTPHHDATLITVGDRVVVDLAVAVIEEVRERRNRISRASKIHHQVEQVLVANVDQILVVASVRDPYLKPGLIDRYLLAARRFHVHPVVCLNKVDLAPREEWAEVAEAYRSAGVALLECSAASGAGLEALRETLRDKVSVLSGQSGVGKSSLLNALDPDLGLAVGEVMRVARKGRHTTTHSRLIPFRFGGYVADTPGIKEFTLWNMTIQEVGELYPDLRDRAAKCRFKDCTHTHEPDCAVVEAVEEGLISPLRYRTYLQILESLLEGKA